jgi:phosphohistidine swiveling domain-containing protein
VRAVALRRPTVTASLVALCLVVLVAAVATALVIRDRHAENEAEQNRRAEVVSAAQRFTVTWNTIDPKRLEQYVDEVGALLTDEFRKEAFGEQTADAIELLKQGGLTSDARVLTNEDDIPLVGISTIDPNSATAMVVADSNRTVEGQRVRRHWRWQLELVEQDGTWLVDDLKTV